MRDDEFIYDDVEDYDEVDLRALSAKLIREALTLGRMTLQSGQIYLLKPTDILNLAKKYVEQVDNTKTKEEDKRLIVEDLGL